MRWEREGREILSGAVVPAAEQSNRQQAAPRESRPLEALLVAKRPQ